MRKWGNGALGEIEVPGSEELLEALRLFNQRNPPPQEEEQDEEGDGEEEEDEEEEGELTFRTPRKRPHSDSPDTGSTIVPGSTFHSIVSSAYTPAPQTVESARRDETATEQIPSSPETELPFMERARKRYASNKATVTTEADSPTVPSNISSAFNAALHHNGS